MPGVASAADGKRGDHEHAGPRDKKRRLSPAHAMSAQMNDDIYVDCRV